MGQLDNLNTSQIGDIFRRLRALETAAAATNTAIGRSGLLVYDGGVITIENGGLDVTGTATISGTLDVTGDVNFDGTTNITGPLVVSGDTDVTGSLDVTGPMKTTSTLSVEGVTTLKNDLNVTTGKIVAGDVTIDPSYFDGSLKFANGSYLAATPNGAQLVKGSGFATVSSSQADIGITGRALIINDVGTYLTDIPTTSSPANLYIDPTTGHIYRSTA